MRKKLLIAIILVISITLIACTNSGIDRQSVDKEDENLIEVNVKDKELLNRSEDISDLVVELYGVDDSTTIVFNNDAYVALIMAFDQEFTEDLRETIIHHVKEKDLQLGNVYLTTNTKTFKQIDGIVFDLLQGETYDSKVKEINKIINNFKE